MILRFTIGLVAILLFIAVVTVIAYILWNFTVIVFTAMILWCVYYMSCQLGDFILEKFDE